MALLQRILIISLAALALCASAAHAATLEGAPAPFQAWVDQMAVPTYAGEVRVTIASPPCGPDPAWGCTLIDSDGVPHVYMRPETLPQMRQVLYHELGHVLDLTSQDAPFQAEFLALWGWHTPDWWLPSSTRGGPPGEWFAEDYRMCADGIQTEAQALHYDSIYEASGYQFPGVDAGGYHLLPNGWAPESQARQRRMLAKLRASCALIRSSF